ncbi:MAG: NADH-quinone oxidoreductase subunit J [Deltaproteobacteria bacterium]|nr:NADH-quinone oxidoreductase subunit J [Deltaproteobacteria bacterium]
MDGKAARWLVGVVLALFMLVLIAPALTAMIPLRLQTGAAALAAGMSNTEIVARELFTTYLLPFEIASVLLLAAIVGTVILARKRYRKVEKG